MDQKQLFKQVIDFQKSTFDNSFKAMSTLQEQGEKMVDTFLEQAAWLPADGKVAVNEWLDTYKNGRDNFMTSVEDNFQKVQGIFSESETRSE